MSDPIFHRLFTTGYWLGVLETFEEGELVSK